MSVQSVRGFRDLLPPDSERTAAFEALARRVLGVYGFRELRVPTLEFQELFVKATGETTDIVEKEMFLLEDAGGRHLALRPEGTPGAVRAYLQHHLSQQGGRTKLFYVGSMFRAERPQAGRYREFEQIGAECFGNAHPAADAESILALAGILDQAGLKGRYAVRMNNLGCESPDCRPAYRTQLLAFLQGARDSLCDNCKRRMERNPLRVLDCKGDGPRIKDQAPKLRPCAACAEHFAAVSSLLAAAEGAPAVSVDPSLVRGLDYYTRTVFEFQSTSVGAQDAIAGGGRYDGLVKSMGGPDTPAVGWALGVERTLLAVSAAGIAAPAPPAPVYVATQARAAALEAAAGGLLHRLREAGIPSEGGLFGHSLKAQLREADRLGARFTVIFGEGEFQEGLCTVKDMKAKDQQWRAAPRDVPGQLAERLRTAP